MLFLGLIFFVLILCISVNIILLFMKIFFLKKIYISNYLDVVLICIRKIGMLLGVVI